MPLQHPARPAPGRDRGAGARSTRASIDTMYSLMASTRDRAGFTLAQQGVFLAVLASPCGRRPGPALLRVTRRRGTRRCLRNVHRQEGLVQGRRVHQGARVGDGAASPPVGGDALAQSAWRRSTTTSLPCRPQPSSTPTHPLFGLYRFKSGFSDQITEYVGTWDLPIRRRAVRRVERASRNAPRISGRTASVTTCCTDARR